MKNDCLNALKGTGCFFVVFMHICFPDMFGKLIISLGGYAVPVFFMISGYFLCKNSVENTNKSLIKKIHRMFKLCFVISIIYCIWNIIISHFGNGKLSIPDFISRHFTFNNLIKFILIQNTDIFGGRSPYWFLYALLLSYIFFWIIYKIPRWRYIYLLIPLLLIAKYYIHTTDLGWDYYNNIWFTALPYFLIGIYLKDKDVTQTIHNSIIIATACMSFFAIIIFTITALSEPIPFLQIAITLWSISLFILALSHPNIYLKPFNVIGERYSLMIYILHPFIISIVEKIAKSLNLESNYYLWIAPIVVLIVALILAIVYEKIIDLTCNNRIRFLFLKK